MATITIKASPKELMSDPIREYIEKKVEMFSDFLREENTVHVEFDSDKHRSGVKYHVEFRIGPGTAIFVEAGGSDVYEAIDLCMPKIKDQLSKRKDKRVSGRRYDGYERKEMIESELSAPTDE